MCFENQNRNRREELICECREVRSDRIDNRHHCDRDHLSDRHRCNRDRDDRCRCHDECRRRRCNFCNFGW